MTGPRSPSSSFRTRYEEAKRQRDRMKSTIDSVFFFCAPDRRGEFDAKDRKPTDPACYHSLGEECAEDLAGDLVTYFTPPEDFWFSYLIDLPEELEDYEKEVLELAEAREADVKALIAQSNYADMAPTIMFDAASHGTPAFWVSKSHLTQPIHVQPVPPAELLIVPGHLGILDRFRETHIRATDLRATFAYELSVGQVSFEGEDLADLRRRMDDTKTSTLETVCWGFIVDWADPGRPVWRMEVTVGGKRLTQEGGVVLGDLAGACPLLVGRFNPRPRQAWGRGAGIRALPDMRVLDRIEEIVLLGLEDAISNTLIYADDGYLDLSEGISPGHAYAAGPRFEAKNLVQLQKAMNLDVGFFTKEDLERRIRALFFQDGPRQRGDTPPTAAQWFDEARRVQQRLGKPAAPLWTEMFYPFVQRVEWLGVQNGLLDPQLQVDGQVVSLQPISPLQKAQNRDQIMISRTNLELIAATAGENLPQVVNLPGTYAKIIKASGDKLTQINTEAPAQPQEAPPDAAQ